MKKVITRFAPSPTGKLHIGNSRIAIINWLYARKENGEFILRFDDTDLARSLGEYKMLIEEDLRFLGLDWDRKFTQSSRLDRYSAAKDFLLSKAILYPCFESQEELEIKRKLQLSAGKPPIYDRAALNLSQEEIDLKFHAGCKPHYRFKISPTLIAWDDMVKGVVRYDGKNLSDPIVIREDGSMTYMLCSVIDDIDYNITHIIRGEDHVSNTAIQIQMFDALSAGIPQFAHLSLIVSRDEKISKRLGGFEIASLRTESGLEPMTINSFFSLLGTSSDILPYKNLEELINEFNISKFSKSPTTYLPEELERLNHRLIINLTYDEIKDRLKEINAEYIDENFWEAVKPNLKKLHEVKDWWNICHSPIKSELPLDKAFLMQATQLLPENPLTKDSWGVWTKTIMQETGLKGRDVFLPLRICITGKASGPEMSGILPLLTRDEILRRIMSKIPNL